VKKLLNIFLTISLLLTSFTTLSAASEDFRIENNTTISYKTGEDFVTVSTMYIREVKNASYFYSAEGEKVFHIPDLPKSKDYELELERQFKIDSLRVRDEGGRSIKYTVEKLALGEGLYIKVPNYKQTTFNSPYKITVEYKTHDLVKRVFNHVIVQSPGLHEDTQFEQVDSSTGTRTVLKYNLKVVTDKALPKVAKIFPSSYKVDETKDSIVYTFIESDRIAQSPYLEFGTKQAYRFEVKFKTPKTDNLIPEKYSSKYNALSTNIYEVSLPRDYSEMNQRVKIEEIYPTPISISKDTEGNILAKFELPANKVSEIYISGYVWVEQDELSSKRAIPNMSLEEYRSAVAKEEYIKKYLLPSKYWEINDLYIKSEAEKIANDSKDLMSTIRNNYSYVNDRLEYDESKASLENERIGAKAALQGGGAVCMEYADSMIALLRAQGIAARAALGYSNLNTLANTNPTGSVRHQWVQVWIPEYGWLSIDPTYESQNMRIGQILDYVLWETFDADHISNIKIYSADRVDTADLNDYSVKVYAVDENTIPDELMDYSDIKSVSESKDSVSDLANILIKTTSLGKAVLIILPIALNPISNINCFSKFKITL
jgi:transglutaminase-like putative cysteine protease